MKKKRSFLGKVIWGIVGLFAFLVIAALFAPEPEPRKTVAAAAPAAESEPAPIRAPAMTTAPAPQPVAADAPVRQISEPARRSPVRRSHEADIYTSLCIQPDEIDACEADKDRIRALYEQAYGGDYSAQRNLAYALDSHSTAVVRNPLNSCVWRLIIVSSGSKQVDQSDWANMNLVCSKLSERDLAQAKAQAVALTTRMVMGDGIKDEVFDTTGLDGTAEPLTAE